MRRLEKDLLQRDFNEFYPSIEASEDSLQAELDLLPEYCHYSDTGCKLSFSCLECPLPECKEEHAHGRDRLSKKGRNAAIVKLHRDEKMSLNELADQYQMSRAGIAKILAAGRKNLNINDQNNP